MCAYILGNACRDKLTSELKNELFQSSEIVRPEMMGTVCVRDLSWKLRNIAGRGLDESIKIGLAPVRGESLGSPLSNLSLELTCYERRGDGTLKDARCGR